jgi:tetratricopeptide (TPR) repeat protein
MGLKNSYNKVIMMAVALFAIALLNANSLGAYSFANWGHGASGYEQMLSEAQDAERPLILYFNTEWCKWCKKFNSEILASWETEDFISNIPKVEINPDNGSDEEALMKKYGITGYPTFLVSIPAFSNKTKRVSTSLKGGKLTVDSFLQEIKARIASQYNQKALSCYKRKAYEDALSYLENAIEYNSESVYAYYLTGFVYHTLGANDKDVELLEKAQENYQKTLELDPDHKEANKELNKLTKFLESME